MSYAFKNIKKHNTVLHLQTGHGKKISVALGRGAKVCRISKSSASQDHKYPSKVQEIVAKRVYGAEGGKGTDEST